MHTSSTIRDRLHALEFAHIPLYISCFAGLLCLKFVLTALYNVYLHPLRKYPGPKCAAVTNLVFHYHAFRGDEPQWEHRLHQMYGEVVRLGPDRLSYIKPQAWKDITGYNGGDRPENLKESGIFGPQHNGVSSLSAIHGTHEHRKRRKSYAHAFSNRALTLQEPLISKYVQMLLNNLRKASGNPGTRVDLVRQFNFTTFDILADLAFGESLGLLEASEYTPWIEAIVANIRFLSLARFMADFPTLGLLVGLFTPSLRRLSKEHFNNAAERVDRRLKKGIDLGQKPDIWKLILEQNDKNGLTEAEMKADASTFMRAGTETTATALSGAIFYLLKNPAKMKRLVEEIRSLKRDDLSLVFLQRSVYLNACLTETMRIYPPSSFALFRRVAKGNAIDGEWVPENTRVGVAPYAAHHSVLNFKNPDEFLPERWLPDTGYESDRKDVFNPFSFGPRNCVGQNLAMHEMRIILASILWHFDLELCPESDSWADQKVFLLWVKPELLVKLRYIR